MQRFSTDTLIVEGLTGGIGHLSTGRGKIRAIAAQFPGLLTADQAETGYFPDSMGLGVKGDGQHQTEPLILAAQIGNHRWQRGFGIGLYRHLLTSFDINNPFYAINGFAS